MYTCSTRTMLCFKYHPKTLLFCELLALTRWPHICLYFSLTECQKSCSHPMTPHFLSLCSHRMPQPVGGRALHPYPLHIWLAGPPPDLHASWLSFLLHYMWLSSSPNSRHKFHEKTPFLNISITQSSFTQEQIQTINRHFGPDSVCYSQYV